MKRNPVQMQHIFVHNENEVLTPERFAHAVKSRRPTDEQKGRVYDWFMELHILERITRCVIQCICVNAAYLQITSQTHSLPGFYSTCGGE